MVRRKKSHIRSAICIMIIAFLTIGYAYLTSSLSINGTTLLKNPTWDVHFENIQVKDGSVTGEQVIEEPEIDTLQTTVSFHIKLKEPGDYYEFTVDAVNAGTIDAMVNTFTDLELTSVQQAYLDASVTYEDGEEILQHQQLLAGDFAVFKVRVAYKQDLDPEDLPSSAEQLDLDFSVEFVQRDDSAIERRAERTLYNVFKKEADSGSGLVLKYDGAHQDAMDASLSTKDIYYWHGSNMTEGKSISDNLNNVIFANLCWKMYRTTDTGGVRLIYNGDIVDGKCLYTRPMHISFGSTYEATLSGNYYYGSSFEYDSSTQKYTLSGDIVQMQWNDSNYQNLVGKFTCLSTSSSMSCSSLKYVLDYKNNTTAYCLSSGSSYYSSLGQVKYNLNHDSLAYSGYMYGDVHQNKSYDVVKTKYLSSSSSFYNNHSLNLNFWYADSYSYDSSTGRYHLVDPYKVSSNSEFANLEGKYTIFSTSNIEEGYTTMRRIVGVINATLYNPSAYYYQLTDGKTNSDYYIKVADSITYDSNTSSYILNSPTTVLYSSWYANYNDYKYKYTCGTTDSSCTTLRYITGVEKHRYSYIKASDRILVAKNRNNLQLTNYLTLRLDEYLNGFGSTYSDYKYTCGDTSSTCTETNLIMIISTTASNYTYVTNTYLGGGITWDGSKYTLTNVIPYENYNNNSQLNTHHYFCVSPGNRSCESVGYIYRLGSTYYSYILLSNGENDVMAIFNEMLADNKYSSNAKKILDAWYKYFLLDYSDYIEDTIFCNNRSIKKYGGWDPNNSDVSTDLLFNSNYDSHLVDLSCSNITDRFSTLNNVAKLDYKIGILTVDEVNLIRSGYGMNYETTYNQFWHMSPYSIGISSATNSLNGGTGWNQFADGWLIAPDNGNSTLSVKPVISIKPSAVIQSGSGSESDPYIIETD